MRSQKVVSFHVFKPEDYKPIPPHEKQRIQKLLIYHILDDVANRFDGCSKFTITIHAKGSA